MYMNNIDSSAGTDAQALVWIHAHPLLLLLIVIWTLFWKGHALWHASRRGQTWWFVIMLVVNSAGILEIIYLFAVLKLKFSQLFQLSIDSKE